ncbi:MAG: adenylate/guanylate cyclase domain-containing protein [Chloroflexi bacterium]|nr:MAG: adenylate/guanylate cyclase domain-containing protein [Chloroflexota bacterium]
MPQTRYAQAPDGVSIAYQVLGDGPRDLVWVPGWVSHLEAAWEEPTLARFFERLASFSRLILFDKRGTGMSDRGSVSELPTLETRMSDVLAVCDAVGSDRAALLGVSEGAPMCALFAATYPGRTTAIILFGGYARRLEAPDYPIGSSLEAREAFHEEIARDWGGPVGLDIRAPSRIHDERFRANWARYLRMGASPAAVLALTRMNAEIDVRPILESIRVPTLVVHRSGDRTIPVEAGRYLAEHIPKASLVEVPGDDHLPWIGDPDRVLGEIEEFLTGVRHQAEPDRVLATVLFTDIVGSTKRAAELGDKAWGELLHAHHAVVREQLARYGGHEMGTAGDGFLATFDGPARAARCGLAIASAVRQLGLEIRAGLHTGEVEQTPDGGIRGLAVHIGARIGALAKPGEVLASRTVKDLVVGSGLVFEDRGAATLRGVPDEWQLYAVSGG